MTEPRVTAAPSNPYAPPSLASYVETTSPAIASSTTADFVCAAELLKKSWLYRRIALSLPEGSVTVEYDARQPYDRVLVDGRLAVSVLSVVWFIPRFAFNIGQRRATIDVRIDWLLRVSFFELKVEERSVYLEQLCSGRATK